MPRTARVKSVSGYYHIVIRGNGKQIIFEDDLDRFAFLSALSKYRKEMDFGLVAYCLMDNHVHMLIHDIHDEIDQIMKKIECSYSYHLNSRYVRSGHVFQDRYKSAVIDSEVYLLSAIRYIHMNPEKAGLCSCDTYRWSSHNAYVRNNQNEEIKAALDNMGGVEGYMSFMKRDDGEKHLDIPDEITHFLNDYEALDIAKKAVGLNDLTAIKGFERSARDENLKRLKDSGLSDRKIARLTGISRDVIRRA